MIGIETIGQGVALLGAAIFVVAAVGLHRLPDPYTRTSAVATAAGLGVAFVVGGAVLMDPQASHVVKAAVAIVLQLATSAVGGMAIARAAAMSGHRFSSSTDVQELALGNDSDRNHDSSPTSKPVGKIDS